MTAAKQKILFIVNPISGRHKKDNFPKIVDTLIDKDKYIYNVVFTEGPGHASELSTEAVSDDVDIVCAVGGDGTMNEVARCLIDTDTTFALVPFGSGNGLARHLHIPLNAKEVIKKVINQGRKSQIDTALVNDTPFISIAGIGFDANIADSFAKDGHRGFHTYFKVIANEYFKAELEEYTLILDEATKITCKPLFVSFANSNQFGYNAEISPKASLDDGLVDVCIFSKPTLMEVPFAATRLMMKKIDTTHFVDIHRAGKIEIVREKDGVVNIDGEPIMMPKNLSIFVKHLSLNILIP